MAATSEPAAGAAPGALSDDEQPTAPYLDAVIAYAFHGIDVGPEPRPYERAERLAAEAYGAVGRVSCESIASYPPGIPALLPGERISTETVDYLTELAVAGARLHGASDPEFRTINVLREAR